MTSTLSSKRLFFEFAYLQLLDILTTIAFLMQGVAEGNPLIRWALREGPGPVQSLLLIKVAALGLAAYCLMSQRNTLLRRVNVFFALLVAYNIICLILASPVFQG